jgi:hypothetical protein
LFYKLDRRFTVLCVGKQPIWTWGSRLLIFFYFNHQSGRSTPQKVVGCAHLPTSAAEKRWPRPASTSSKGVVKQMTSRETGALMANRFRPF